MNESNFHYSLPSILSIFQLSHFLPNCEVFAKARSFDRREKNPAETHPFYTVSFDPNFIVIFSGKNHLLEGKPNFMSLEKKFGDMILQKWHLRVIMSLIRPDLTDFTILFQLYIPISNLIPSLKLVRKSKESELTRQIICRKCRFSIRHR